MGTCVNHTTPHHTRDRDIRMGGIFQRWGHLTPDSSDYSPIKNPFERGWWDGAPRMLRSARRSSPGSTGIPKADPCGQTPIPCVLLVLLLVRWYGRQAGRQEKAWQVAFRPLAGRAGQPVVGYSGLGGSQKASKHQKVNRLQPVPRCLCLFPPRYSQLRAFVSRGGLEVSCCDTGTAE